METRSSPSTSSSSVVEPVVGTKRGGRVRSLPPLVKTTASSIQRVSDKKTGESRGEPVAQESLHSKRELEEVPPSDLCLKRPRSKKVQESSRAGKEQPPVFALPAFSLYTSRFSHTYIATLLPRHK